LGAEAEAKTGHRGDPRLAGRVKSGIQVTPDFSAGLPIPRRSPSASACEPWRDWIASQLAAGRNAKAIWQDLVDDHGFTATYQSVKRFVRKLQDGSPRQACAIIETPPGEEAQVDYGDGPMVRDPNTGKYRRTRLFVLTLGYSRKSVRLLTWQSRVCRSGPNSTSKLSAGRAESRDSWCSIFCAKASSSPTSTIPR
jgi:hypothetical protein